MLKVYIFFTIIFQMFSMFATPVIYSKNLSLNAKIITIGAYSTYHVSDKVLVRSDVLYSSGKASIDAKNIIFIVEDFSEFKAKVICSNICKIYTNTPLNLIQFPGVEQFIIVPLDLNVNDQNSIPPTVSKQANQIYAGLIGSFFCLQFLGLIGGILFSMIVI